MCSKLKIVEEWHALASPSRNNIVKGERRSKCIRSLNEPGNLERIALYSSEKSANIAKGQMRSMYSDHSPIPELERIRVRVTIEEID